MKNKIFRVVISLALYSAIIILCLSNIGIMRRAESASISENSYFKPTETLVTPHIQWLKPYYKGKTKALFIIPRTSMRDVVELAERMDLDYNVFATENSRSLAVDDKTPGSDPASRQSALNDALKNDYDVIIIANYNWDALPADFAQNILAKVKAGTGLVGVVNNTGSDINSAIPGGLSTQSRADFNSLLASCPFSISTEKTGQLSFGVKTPDVLLSSIADIGKLGNGNVCLFTYKPKRLNAIVPGSSGGIIGRDPTGFDYQLATVIRAILWASNRIPDVSIVPASPSLISKMNETGNQKAIFNLNNTKTPVNANTDFFIINSEGTTVFEKKSSSNIASGSSSISFDIPVLPIGKYRLNVIVSQTEGIINFATGIMMVTGNSSISNIVMDKTSFSNTDQASGKIMLINPVSGMKVRVGRYDNFDRLVDQKVYPADTQTSFALNSSGALPTVMNYIRADLLSSDGALIDSEKVYYSINNIRPSNDDIRVVVWSRSIKEDRYYTPSILKYWRDSGVDTIYSAFSEHAPLANMNGIPILTNLIDEKTSNSLKKTVPRRTGNDLIRQPCLTDPAYLTDLDKTLTDGANQWKDYSVAEFSLGDECCFCDGNFDLCFSPTCITDFKRFLSTEYPSINDLNNEYGTSYQSFNDVNPLPIDAARQQNQISLWIDHRLHMDSQWAGIFQHSRDTIKRTIPDANTGYEASDTFATTWHADDYMQLVKSINLNSIYYRPFQSAVWGSRFPQGNLLGLGWIGNYTTQLALNHDYNTMMMPWKTVFEGANSLWIWQAQPSVGSVTAPDFSFYPQFQDALSTIKELKSGLGKALINAERQTDAGIYYSPSSIYTETYIGGKIDSNADYQTAALLSRSLNFQPKVYGSEDAANGMLLKDKPKLLIMPDIQSISSIEADSIRQYVKNGGFLIADVNPGVRDAHGKLLASGSLDDVFGVRLHGDDPLISAVPSINSGGNFNPSAMLSSKSIELKGGMANGKAGNAPVVIVNTFGAGKTMLLNFAIDKIGDNDLIPFSSMISKFLTDSGIYPTVKIDNAILMDLEMNRFRSGGIQYLCLMQDWGGDKKSDIPADRQSTRTSFHVPAKYHIYNMRNNSYIGYLSDSDINIRPLDPIILALLPYKISEVKLNLSNSSLQQGDTLQYTLSIGTEGGAAPDPQVVRVRLTDPSGSDVSYYGANLIVKGLIVNKLPLALNEKPGKWTITATDIISGLSASANFNVSNR